MSPSRLSVPALLVAALFSLDARAQQVLPPPLVGGPPSEVPVAVQILRWQMLDNSTSSLMFRSMDSLFTIRKVARSGQVWALPRNDRSLDFTYTWNGQARPAEAFLERTYTNAL